MWKSVLRLQARMPSFPENFAHAKWRAVRGVNPPKSVCGGSWGDPLEGE